MKHKHYEMIVVKAANMDLVVFQTDDDLKEWYVLDRFPMWGESTNYFLCLPQHKDACLHWLNGGKAEALHEDFGLMELADSEAIEWGVKSVFMKDSIEIRIKPKKEKRWIAVNSDGYVMPVHCGNIESARQHASHIDSRLTENIQFIEIEVEV